MNSFELYETVPSGKRLGNMLGENGALELSETSTVCDFFPIRLVYDTSYWV